MQRRTILKRIGATVGTTTLAATGTVSADSLPGRTVDVSDVTGEVPVAELLTDTERADLSASIASETVWIAPDADVVALDEDCCDLRCESAKLEPACDCYRCI